MVASVKATVLPCKCARRRGEKFYRLVSGLEIEKIEQVVVEAI